ncbi:MAG: exodeoxyribonuclease V subunit beta [Mariprofundus sp.]
MSDVMILNADLTLRMELNGFKLVEASAGTGKTYAIGNLYLRMLLEGCKVSEILVVTFTTAATEELRGRIRLRIHQALKHLQDADADDLFLSCWTDSLRDDASKLEDAASQLKLALNSMDEAAIYTIHGFCQRALTEHAFNSRQPFDVEMITDDSEIWQAAIKDWWRIHAYGLDETRLTLLSKALGGVDDLIKLEQPLRKPRVRLLPEINDSLDVLFARWQALEVKCARLAAMWKKDRKLLETTLYSDALKRAKNIYKLVNLPTLIEALDIYFTSGQWFAFADELTAVRASELLSQLKVRQCEDGLEHSFFALVDEILDSAATVQQQFRIRALAEAHGWAYQRVAHTKQQAGQLSFDDQLVLLEQALAGNQELGIQIHERFPVAMIDEFQDTDGIQYDIFKHIYHGRSQGTLVMIGDPKQAIYSFRGGDIFTYIQAKHDATEHYTLDTNWRSTPRLIDAVNRIFSGRSDPFIYEDIPFSVVQTPPDKEHKLLCENGEELTPLTVWHIPTAANGKALAKKAAQPLMHAHTANEIARLIQAGREGVVTLGDDAVKPGDIAVLVRSHIEADELRDALSRRGVDAVASGNEQVFNSEEAAGLQLLLAAVIDFRDAGLLRQAMASSLFAYQYQEIHERFSDEQSWLVWGELFQQLHDAWSNRGFMAMFQQLLIAVGGRLALLHDASRRLTNLVHLGELLQQASQSVTGMDALAHWFDQQLTHDSREAELRLENDGDLVRIVTIHASKGLEYPILFLPYMWSCKPRALDKELLPFFDEQAHQHCLHAEADVQHLRLAEKERLAEDIRLAYVALTRARAKIYLGWGNTANAGKTAMGWLLHNLQQAEELQDATPEAFARPVDIEQDLKRLTNTGNLELVAITADLPMPLLLPEQNVAAADCQAAEFSGNIATDWRISSFSSMTRDVHQLSRPGERMQSDDPVFQFPAGSQTGLFLHALLEKLDFQHDVDSKVLEFASREAARYGLDPDQAPLISAWVQDVLVTALDQRGLTLAQIGAERRLNELAFDFSVSRIDIKLLNHSLDQAAGVSLQPLQISDCRGYITGVIDLLFEFEGRFYLADYKSNLLGFTLADYAPAALHQAVLDRRYDLQYLIYSLALHRYLKLRLPDYDYDRHFGGAYYLFLRGMRPQHGADYGVHFDRPERSLIECLDSDIFNAEVLL